MSLELQFVETSSYFKVVMTGLYTDLNSIGAIREIIAEFDQSVHHRMLIDKHQMRVDASVLINYRAGKVASELVRTKKHRIAVVANPEFQESDRFFETVAINNGTNIRFFLQESSALHWLLAEPPIQETEVPSATVRTDSANG